MRPAVDEALRALQGLLRALDHDAELYDVALDAWLPELRAAERKLAVAVEADDSRLRKRAARRLRAVRDTVWVCTSCRAAGTLRIGGDFVDTPAGVLHSPCVQDHSPLPAKIGGKCVADVDLNVHTED